MTYQNNQFQYIFIFGIFFQNFMYKTLRRVPMDGYLIGCQKVHRGVCFGGQLDPIEKNIAKFNKTCKTHKSI